MTIPSVKPLPAIAICATGGALLGFAISKLLKGKVNLTVAIIAGIAIGAGAGYMVSDKTTGWLAS